MTEGLNQDTARPLGQAMSLGGDPEKLAAYYRDWAASYDSDVGADEYGLPGSVLITLDAAIEQMAGLADRDIIILDAGCGTGRIGMVLAARGYSCIDGIDLSPEMVALAAERTRDDGGPVYRRLDGGVDLTLAPAPRYMAAADLVIVGGVFTVGHIAPESLWQVSKLVRPGGLLITTVRPGYFDTTNYDKVSEQFSQSETADLLVAFTSLPYTADTDGRYYAYRVN